MIRLLRKFLGLSAFLPFALHAAGLAKVVEDAPGHLVLDVKVPSFSVHTGQGVAGARVVCGGCESPVQAGAPDLPLHRFTVVSGPSEPQIGLEILESETRVVSAGIAPVPRYLTPTRPEYVPDPDAYSQAAGARARMPAYRYIRGVPTREVEIPLALWNPGPRTLTLIKRMRVRMDFPGVLSRPAPALGGYLRNEVLNPAGGVWLYPGPGFAMARRGRAFAPGALGKSAAGPATGIGDTLIRFRVRVKSVESFSEDRYYAVTYASLGDDIAKILRSSRKLRWMRLLAGPNDSLPLAMDSSVSSGRLHEIPMETVDADSDGTFSPGDTLKFFAHGTNIWKRNENPATTIRYEFTNDPYSLDNYYYLDFGIPNRDGLRLTARATPAAVGAPLASTWYYLRAEKDLGTSSCDLNNEVDVNTGPDWHWKWKGDCKSSPDLAMTSGDLASEETKTLPDNAGDSVLLGLYTFPNSGAVFEAEYAGNDLERYPDSISPGHWFAWTGSLPASGSWIPDKVTWGGSSRRFEGYTLIYRRAHSLADGAAWIFPPETGRPVSYRVKDGAGAYCARIINGEADRLLILDGNGVFTDSLPAGADARYFIFRQPAPVAQASLSLEVLPPGAPKGPIRDLANCDNLEPGQFPEYLIITSRSLVEKALQLRDYRDSSGRVIRARPAVVTVEDIYRQFSGGRLSPVAIRDFLRYAYLGWGRGASAAGILKYVVLFGDGHYDYRNLGAAVRGNTPNVVPPFEVMWPSLGGSDTDQLATDDFFGMFEPGPFGLQDMPLSLAIGRIPVQSPEEADAYLEKIRAYEDPKNSGEWRAHVILAADDNLQRGNAGNLDPIQPGHTTDTDNLGKTILGNEAGTILDKVYLLDYPLNSAFHKPQAAQDLLTLLNRGAVATNYVGHGASNQWADEVLLQTNDAVARMRNKGRTGMVNAFSCTVGRFESLGSEGMSEQFVKQPEVGAIGTISATRESYPTPNLALANEFYKRAFPPSDSDAVATVGEALQYAKNGITTGSNNLKYALLGEPVLLLRKPPLRLELTGVMDTIRALDCGTIRGRVEGGSGNGRVNVKVIAGDVHKVYTDLGDGMWDQKVDKRGNILFEGTVPYDKGAFSIRYFIPKQISFGDTNALVTAFAWDSTQEREGTAARVGLHIRGTSNSACASDPDGKGPAIRITGCERSETGGLDFPGKVKLSLPYCLQIDVTDSTGGVISAEGPDEGTTLEIPGALDPFHPQPGIDDLFHKTYQLTLDPKVIRPGSHLLKVSARDGFGNYSARQLQMDLTLDSSLVAIQVYNHPNPMKRKGTTFYFSTGMPQEELEYGPNLQAGTPRLSFEVRIFNQAGRLVKVLRDAVSGEARWDGRDEWGNPQANGIYFYKVTATQVRFDYDDRPGFSTVTSKYNTLVISR